MQEITARIESFVVFGLRRFESGELFGIFTS
jgi:hypothetical protein